jgi:hypothetical protein
MGDGKKPDKEYPLHFLSICIQLNFFGRIKVKHVNIFVSPFVFNTKDKNKIHCSNSHNQKKEKKKREKY